MMGALLQSAFCDPAVAPMDYLTQFKFIRAFTCTYANVAGFFVVGLFVYGAVGLSIYIRTGSVMIPTVLLLLTGGAIMPQIASPGTSIAAVMLLTAGAGIFALLYYRYST